MKFLRFLVLIAALLAVYAAQYLFDQSSLEFLRSPWIAQNLPSLRDLLGWSPGDRQTLGLYLAGIGALFFGFVAYGWSPLSAAADDSPPSPHRSTPGLVLLGVGVSLGAALLIYFQQNQAEPFWTQALWLAAIVAYVLGSWLLTGSSTAAASDPAPERSWPLLVALLAVAGLLLAWQLATVPVRVDGDPASHGLQALQIASGLEERIFAPGWANISLLAYYPAAVGMQLSGDWLLGSRLAGLYAGLLTIFGVWLLGCELFRRPPNEENDMDDGRQMALLAAAFTGAGYTFLHFGRMPQYLEPVAWGVLGLWALQRGARTGSRATLALGGILLALSGTLYYSGRVFGALALIWWLWFLLARRGWMRRVGWTGFGVWAGGGFVFLAPFLGVWLRSPAVFSTRWQEVSIFNPGGLIHMQGVYGVQGLGPVILENARRTLLTFWIFGDKSTHFGWPGPMLDSLIGPLFFLGLGYLILNLDRLQNWQLLTWLAAVLALGGVLTINTPFWPRLLPALPAAGLICALAVDRTRAVLVRTTAPWLGRFSLSVAVGLLVLAAAYNWVGWYEIQTIHGDPESYAGRVVRSLPAGRTAVLVETGDDQRAQWSDRTVEFLAGGPYAGKHAAIDVNHWPLNLPPESSVILQPDDRALATELQRRYPGGTFFLQRNRAGNPVIMVYQLP